jgi:hypothetical protein
MPDSHNTTRNIIIGAVLIVFIGMGVYFLPCPTSSQYIYFRIVLALAVAILSVLLVGSITFNGKIAGNNVKAVGGFAVFIILIIFTPSIVDTTNKCVPDTDYVVVVSKADGGSVDGLKGSISIKINDFIEERDISSSGKVYFDHVPIRLLPYKATIQIKGNRFWFIKTKSAVLDTLLPEQSITLPVQPDQTLCCLSGIVMDRETSKGIGGVEVRMDTLLVETNSRGLFNLNIPAGLQADSIILRLTAKGYIPATETGYPALKVTKEIYLDATKN